METRVVINENERIDDLQCQGLKVISNPDVFCFGIDAVLLANYAKAKPGQRVLDMGTGNGVIPILMTGKCPGACFTGLELQEISYDLAVRSTILNGLTQQVKMVQGDIREASHLFGGASFDVITVNPPYMNENHGLVNPLGHKAIARHEIACTLEDVIREASRMLTFRGCFYMVHRPRRLGEIICTMREHRLEPKELVMVHTHAHKEAKLVLVLGVKDGSAFLKVKPPLIIYGENGKYTKDMEHWTGSV